MQTLERMKSRTSEDLDASSETDKRVREQKVSDPEILRPEEHRILMAQCSILVMIASIVVWLIVL